MNQKKHRHRHHHPPSPLQPKHEFSVDVTCEGSSNTVTRVLSKLGGGQFEIDLPNERVYMDSEHSVDTAGDPEENRGDRSLSGPQLARAWAPACRMDPSGQDTHPFLLSRQTWNLAILLTMGVPAEILTCPAPLVSLQ